MYYNLLKKYIDRLRKEDILNYSIKENIKLTERELNIIYNAIKNRFNEIYNDGITIIDEYKNMLENNTYIKLKELYIKAKEKLL